MTRTAPPSGRRRVSFVSCVRLSERSPRPGDMSGRSREAGSASAPGGGSRTRPAACQHADRAELAFHVGRAASRALAALAGGVGRHREPDLEEGAAFATRELVARHGNGGRQGRSGDDKSLNRNIEMLLRVLKASSYSPVRRGAAALRSAAVLCLPARCDYAASAAVHAQGL